MFQEPLDFSPVFGSRERFTVLWRLTKTRKWSCIFPKLFIIIFGHINTQVSSPILHQSSTYQTGRVRSGTECFRCRHAINSEFKAINCDISKQSEKFDRATVWKELKNKKWPISDGWYDWIRQWQWPPWSDQKLLLFDFSFENAPVSCWCVLM